MFTKKDKIKNMFQIVLSLLRSFNVTTFCPNLDKTGFDISCKLSPKEKETVCMNCKTHFSGKIRKIFQIVFC